MTKFHGESEKWFKMPTLFHLSPEIHSYLVLLFPNLADFDPYENAFHLLALLGMFLSLLGLLWNRFANFPVFFALWVTYLSIVNVGQTFMSFQWDILVIESGFLMALYVPRHGKHKNEGAIDEIAMTCRELLRWLAFRLMYGSGVTKIFANCPAWWSYSALHHHFETQPIPHYLGWLAHQLPDLVKRHLTAEALFIEVFMALAMIVPLKPVRTIGALGNIGLQVGILLTGNYTYFNFLTICL